MGKRRAAIRSLSYESRMHLICHSIPDDDDDDTSLDQVTVSRGCSRLHHSDPSPGTFRSVRKKRLLASSSASGLPTGVTASRLRGEALHLQHGQLLSFNDKPVLYENGLSSSSSELDMTCAMSQPPFPQFKRSQTPNGLPKFGSPQALSCDYRSLSLSLKRQAAPNSARSSSSSLVEGNTTCVSVVKKAWHTFKSAICEAIYSFTNCESEPFDMPGPLRSRGVIAIAPDGTLVRTFFPKRQSAHGAGIACHPYLTSQPSPDNWAARAVQEGETSGQHVNSLMAGPSGIYRRGFDREREDMSERLATLFQ